MIDIKECLIQPDLGNNILDEVRNYIRNSGVPVYGLKSQEGFWRFLMLRHSVAHDQWMVNIITSVEDRKTVQPLADLLMEKYSQIVSVINNITAKKASVAVGEHEILLAGSSYLTDKLGEFEFEISSNSFFQTNTNGAEDLYQIVKDFAGLTGRETVVDLYSGTGTIPIWLSDSAEKIVGIEIVESAVSDAMKNCSRNGVTNCSFIPGDINDVLSQIIEKPDILIIDPPRVGMHKKVLKKVVDMESPVIVYVSCNPSTLARDLGLLKEHYFVLEVQPVDMFPHTYHIESVAKLKKK